MLDTVRTSRPPQAEPASSQGRQGHFPGFDGLRAIATAPGSPATTSMYRDLIGGYPTEGEHLLGDLLERAGQLDVRTPLLELATISLRVYENRL